MNKYLSINEACQIIGISRAMFYKLLNEKKAPKIIKIGRRVVLSPDSLESWMKTMEHDNTEGG